MKPLPTLIFSCVLLLACNQCVLQAQQTNREQPRQRDTGGVGSVPASTTYLAHNPQ